MKTIRTLYYKMMIRIHSVNAYLHAHQGERDLVNVAISRRNEYERQLDILSIQP